MVMDEAYADFCDTSAMGLLPEYDNLVIARTFSKWYLCEVFICPLFFLVDFFLWGGKGGSCRAAFRVCYCSCWISQDHAGN